jgi:predicted flap endonuclease-1-like 5' DNA nuclease
MAWFIGQSLIMIGLAFVLGLLVGWLIWGRSRPAPAASAAETAAPALPPAPVMRMPLVVPAEPDPDDLERIEGIGPQMAAALKQAGITTYTQLATADEATLREAIEARGLRFAPSIVTWGKQARLLADGDEAGFADLTRRLVAGRDEGRE